MLCFFCCGQPVAVRMPPLMTELPPAVGIFSRTIVLAPAFLASMAAASPAKPEPITMTSTVSSHFCGSLTAPAACAEPKRPAAPSAKEPLRSVRRLRADILSPLALDARRFSRCGRPTLGRRRPSGAAARASNKLLIFSCFGGKSNLDFSAHVHSPTVNLLGDLPDAKKAVRRAGGSGAPADRSDD